jgi:hypothetical protein
LDRLFWISPRRFWPGWKSVIIIVRPDTVAAWHQAGFRWYWRWRSSGPPGRPKVAKELRDLVRRVARENPGWGAPKIHGELLKLGFEISETTVSRYLRRVHRRGYPGMSWLASLRNHREVIVALDYFTIPTVTFRTLYCLFVIEHGRRRILHFNITRHPTSDWVLQQLREAFSEARPYRYVITASLKSTGLNPKRTSIQAPWQNWIRGALDRQLSPRTS